MMKWADVKKKSDRKLNHKDLHPVVREKAKKLVKLAYEEGVAVCITQGVRTKEEQDALYAIGRTKPGSIVTNAPGGTSFHNYGLAIDFALYTPDGKSVKWDEFVDYDRDGVRDWMEVVAIAKRLGFEWGGDWVGFRDSPHLQMDFGYTITQLLSGKRPPKDVAKPEDRPKIPKPAPKPAPVKSGPIVPYPKNPLYLGAPNMKSIDIQRIENALGTKVDGVFDAQLRLAVIAYQKRKKLKADGIVGEVTWNVMF